MNQRKTRRCEVSLPIRYTADGERIHDGIVLTLGSTGLFVQTEDLLPTGARLRLETSLGGAIGVLRCEGRVTNHNRRSGTSVIPGFGVCFDELPEIVVQGIDRFIDSYPGAIAVDADGRVPWAVEDPEGPPGGSCGRPATSIRCPIRAVSRPTSIAPSGCHRSSTGSRASGSGSRTGTAPCCPSTGCPGTGWRPRPDRRAGSRRTPSTRPAAPSPSPWRPRCGRSMRSRLSTAAWRRRPTSSSTSSTGPADGPRAPRPPSTSWSRPAGATGTRPGPSPSPRPGRGSRPSAAGSVA